MGMIGRATIPHPDTLAEMKARTKPIWWSNPKHPTDPPNWGGIAAELAIAEKVAVNGPGPYDEFWGTEVYELHNWRMMADDLFEEAYFG